MEEELARPEWDFSRRYLKERGVIDDELLLELWAYEFSRQNTELKKAILEWRDCLAKPISFETLKRESSGSPMLQIRANPQKGIEAKSVINRYPGAYVFFPEWPDTPFLEIDVEERNRRIELAKPFSWYATNPNWSKGLEDYPASLEANPKSLGLHPGWPRPDAWDALVRDLYESAPQSKLRAFKDDEPSGPHSAADFLPPESEKFVYATSECVLFRIPWKYDDEIIVSLLRKWLKENRPDSENPPKISHSHPGNTQVQNAKKHLEMLGRFRLAKVSLDGAATLHPSEDEQLFTDASHLDRTKKTITREVQRFAPIISLIKEK
jgi:hypothetical protein